jgi:hypothetical protein
MGEWGPRRKARTASAQSVQATVRSISGFFISAPLCVSLDTSITATGPAIGPLQRSQRYGMGRRRGAALVVVVVAAIMAADSSMA